jgi:hypothetical protein
MEGRGGWEDTWLRTFLDDLDKSTLYALWREKNPGEAKQFDEFCRLLKTVDGPHEWPPLSTPLGRVLVRSAAACASHA